MEARFGELAALLPAARASGSPRASSRREQAARARAAAEAQRTEMTDRLAGAAGRARQARWRPGARGRATRQRCARGGSGADERAVSDAAARRTRPPPSRRPPPPTAARAGGEHEQIRAGAGRSGRGRGGRPPPPGRAAQPTVRQLEQELQRQAQTLRSLEGERTALEGELASLRERVDPGRGPSRQPPAVSWPAPSAGATHAIERAGFLSQETQRCRGRRRARPPPGRRNPRARGDEPGRSPPGRGVAGADDRPPPGAGGAGARPRGPGARRPPRSWRRGTASTAACWVRSATSSAPAARTRSWPSGCWATGCTRCWCATRRRCARFRPGTRSSSPGALVLLPLDPGPLAAERRPARWTTGFAAEGPAAGWVRAALAGSEVLDQSGRVLRRASGAIFLGGAGAPSGPLRRRAELAALGQEVEQAGDRRWPRPKQRCGRPSTRWLSGSAR